MSEGRTTTEQERQFALYNWRTAKEAGKRLGGVSSTQVLAWYDAGLLTGFDASREGAKKRDIRFKDDWLAEFEVRRTKKADAA